MLGKIVFGIAATIIAVEAVELAVKYKTCRYWERAIKDIPWPIK